MYERKWHHFFSINRAIRLSKGITQADLEIKTSGNLATYFYSEFAWLKLDFNRAYCRCRIFIIYESFLNNISLKWSHGRKIFSTVCKAPVIWDRQKSKALIRSAWRKARSTMRGSDVTRAPKHHPPTFMVRIFLSMYGFGKRIPSFILHVHSFSWWILLFFSIPWYFYHTLI